MVKVVLVDKDESKLFENDSYARTKIIEYKDHRFVYMPLWWLSGLKMKVVLDKGLELASRSKGIIIDLRNGFGGSPAVDYIRPFLKNGLETITIESIGRDHISKSTAAGFNKPIIVLINSGSRSGKELLAYYFKKTQRGVLVGERTAGYVTAGKYQRISQNSILYYCVEMIVVDSKRLEGVGIEPDIEVPFDIRFAAGKDVQLERAKDEMVKLIVASKK